MLKIVPDPPIPSESLTTLEEILLQISEYLVCALTVSQHSVQLHAKPPGQVLALAAMHEIERAHALAEMALSRVQAQH